MKLSANGKAFSSSADVSKCLPLPGNAEGTAVGDTCKIRAETRVSGLIRFGGLSRKGSTRSSVGCHVPIAFKTSLHFSLDSS